MRRIGKIQSMPVDPMVTAKMQRNMLIFQSEWIRSRHNDELALGLTTTLSPAQYTQFLQYIQGLRTCLDPNITDATKIIWPIKPSFIS